MSGPHAESLSPCVCPAGLFPGGQWLKCLWFHLTSRGGSLAATSGGCGPGHSPLASASLPLPVHQPANPKMEKSIMIGFNITPTYCLCTPNVWLSFWLWKFGASINIYWLPVLFLLVQFLLCSLEERTGRKKILMDSKWHLGGKTFGTQTVWDFKNKVEETCPSPLNLLKL